MKRLLMLLTFVTALFLSVFAAAMPCMALADDYVVKIGDTTLSETNPTMGGTTGIATLSTDEFGNFSLTLDGFTYSGSEGISYSGTSVLTIVLKGSNSIMSSNACVSSSNSGSLNITAEDGGALTLISSEGSALSGSIANSISGAGWDNAGGSGIGQIIETNDTPRSVSGYKRAVFPANFTIISVNVNNGVISAPATAIAGDTVTVSATPAATYQLDMIYVTAADGSSVAVSGNTFTMPASAVFVAAIFKSSQVPTPVTPTAMVTLTYDLVGGTYDGTTGAIGVSVARGSTATILNAPTRNGYTFQYWESSDGSHYNPGDSYQVMGDHSFTAVWAKNATPPTSPEVVNPAVPITPAPRPTAPTPGSTSSQSESGGSVPATGASSPLVVIVVLALLGTALVLVGRAFRRRS